MKIKRDELIILDECGRVYLRPITGLDTTDIVRWRNQEFVRKNFIFNQDFTFEMHMNWLQTKVNTGQVIQYIIEHRKDHCSIGSIYIRDIDIKNRSAEFGIFIGEDSYRNQGFGAESAKLFLSYCFFLGFHRIFLRVITDNVIAINSYKKVGFKQEGILRDMIIQNGVYKDIMFMSILENDKEDDTYKC